MMQLLDEPRSVGHLTEKEIGREVSPPAVGPGRVEPPTHASMPRLRTARLYFAPAPADDADRPAAPAPRECRVDWAERAFEAGWVGLMAVCAAECIYRLLWAVQP